MRTPCATLPGSRRPSTSASATWPTAADDLAGSAHVVTANPPYIPLEAFESVAIEARDHDPPRPVVRRRRPRRDPGRRRRRRPAARRRRSGAVRARRRPGRGRPSRVVRRRRPTGATSATTATSAAAAEFVSARRVAGRSGSCLARWPRDRRPGDRTSADRAERRLLRASTPDERRRTGLTPPRKRGRSAAAGLVVMPTDTVYGARGRRVRPDRRAPPAAGQGPRPPDADARS